MSEGRGFTKLTAVARLLTVSVAWSPELCLHIRVRIRYFMSDVALQHIGSS